MDKTMAKVEIEYQIALWIIQNLHREQVISEQETIKAKKKLMKEYPSISASVDDRTDVSFRKVGGAETSALSSRIRCDKCGLGFGIRPWHSESYNYKVWCCRSYGLKGRYCRNTHVYEREMYQAFLEMAKHLALTNPHIIEKCLRLYSDKQKVFQRIGQFMEFEWIDELSFFMVIDVIYVRPYNRVHFMIADGTEFDCYIGDHKKEKVFSRGPGNVKKSSGKKVLHPCMNCGDEVPQNPGRKVKKFCSDKCRHAWWNRNLDQVNRKTNYNAVCKYCGKEFVVYGNSERKFCSHECYIADRFGDE